MSDEHIPDVRDQLPEYVSGRLTPAERRRVEDALEHREDARSDLEVIRLVQRATPTPQLDMERIASAISSSSDSRPRSARLSGRGPALHAPRRRIAATIAVLLGSGITASVVQHQGGATYPTASHVVRQPAATTRETAVARTPVASEAQPAAGRSADAERDAALEDVAGVVLDDPASLTPEEETALVEHLRDTRALPPADPQPVAPIIDMEVR